jgi:large subunit ribosomal protein L12
MEYVYAAMLLHKASKKVDEASIKKVLESAGVAVDDTKVKALVSALEGINIDDAIKSAAVAPVAAPAGGHAPSGKAPEKKEEKKEDKKSEEEASAGLGSLFG